MVTFKMGSSVICLSHSYSNSNNTISCERLSEFSSRSGVQTTQMRGIWATRKLAQIVEVQITSHMKLSIRVRYNGLIKLDLNLLLLCGACVPKDEPLVISQDI